MALRTIDSASSRLRHHHRRRVAAHALHGGEQRRDRPVPLRERAAQLLLLRFEIAEPGFDQVELALALLDQARGLDQPLVDALALGAELVHIGLQLLGPALRRLQAAAVGVQALAGFVGGSRALGGGVTGRAIAPATATHAPISIFRAPAKVPLSPLPQETAVARFQSRRIRGGCKPALHRIPYQRSHQLWHG